ncbi:carbohydrate-binding protein [Paenibacillus planticolens]|uniref:Carbohydrate-binding protein n=1 Tax=Paenibacillus planticolens TaxID=2654976 RepID=A0ABX1ZFQ4_9BACL|nr:carbohydrate-binding protein [Paenibacillus planticolens]NOU98920.1 carbohydrate-binding protein [Paenibacillus planticolens]
MAGWNPVRPLENPESAYRNRLHENFYMGSSLFTFSSETTMAAIGTNSPKLNNNSMGGNEMLNKRFMSLVSVFSICTSMLISVSPTTQAAEQAVTQPATYDTILPKVSTAPKKVIVLDVNIDKSAHDWAANDALLAISVIQGLVNRSSDTKIYVVGYQFEHLWDPPSVDRTVLNIPSYFDVPKEYAQLDRTKKYPALSYLLENYSSYIKGKIMIPNLSGDSSYQQGALCAGITASGIEDTITVTPRLDAYLQSEGYNFTQKADLTAMTSDQAFDWSYSNYFRPETNRKVVGTTTTGSVFGRGANDMASGIFDYWVANKVFVFNASQSKFPTILNKTNYPQGTPVIGMTGDEETMIKPIQTLGYPYIMAYDWNYSVKSSFASDFNNIRKPSTPYAYPAGPNDVYITNLVTDGDNVGAPFNYHIADKVFSEHQGEVSIGWTYNPLLLDIDPKMTEFMSKYYPDMYENVVGTQDDLGGGFHLSNVPEGYRNFFANVKRLTDGMGFYSFNEISRSDVLTYAAQLNPYHLFGGYGDDAYDYTYNASTQSFIHGTDIKYDRNPSVQVDSIRSKVAASAAGPIFLSVNANSGRIGTLTGRDEYNWGDQPNRIYQMQQNLLNNPQGKTYHFVTPKEFAATWKAWKGYIPASQGAAPAPEQTPSDWMPPMPLPRSGWTITASNNGANVNKMKDLALDSKWSTNAVQTPGQYVQIDLGSAQTFNKLTMEVTNSIGDYPSAYSVYVSNDGINWGAPVASGTGNNEYTLITFEKTTSRYVKIVQTGTNSAHYWSIHELNLYNFDGEMLTPKPNASINLNTNTFSKIEAEDFISKSESIVVQNAPDGGSSLGGLTNNSYTVYKNVDFGMTASGFSARVSADANSGGTIEVRLDSPTGTLAGTLNVNPTGGSSTYQTLSSAVTNITGIHDVYLVFKTAKSNVGNLDWFKFIFRSALGQIEAEDYDSKSGSFSTESNTPDTGGGQNIGNVKNGYYLAYNSINFDSGVSEFNVRVSADQFAGGTIEVRLDSPTGTLAGALDVSDTGGWSKYQTLSTPIINVTGVHDVYLVFKTSKQYVCNVNWFKFNVLPSSIKTITNITAPAPVTGVVNGTAKTAEALGLPSTVQLITDTGNVTATVAWDVEASSYDPSQKTQQIFTVSGTVTLPSGVANPNNVALTTSISVTVLPVRSAFNQIEAENYDSKSGNFITENNTPDTGGGQDMGNVKDGYYLVYKNLYFANGALEFNARVSADQFAGGTIEVRLDSPTGTLAGSLTVSDTGGWSNYKTLSTPITNATGFHDLYLVFKTTKQYVCNLNWFKFSRAALSSNADLRALSLSSGELSPAFNTGITSYTANVPNSVSSIVMTASVDDMNSTVSVNGQNVTTGQASAPINLNEGSNVIGVVVTAPDLTTKTYTVTVNRQNAVPVTVLSGASTVVAGQPLVMSVGLSNISQSVYPSVYGQDLTLHYDPLNLQFNSVTSLKEGFQVIDQKETAPGQLRIVAASMGANVPAQGDLLAIQFTAKSVTQATNTTISVDHVVIANGQGNELQVGRASRDIQITVPTVPVDKSLLNMAIASAQAMYDAGVEGDGDGQYAIGSKAQLQSAIDAAKAAVNDSNATQQQVDIAKAALEAAMQVFTSKKIIADVNGGGVSIGDLAVVAAAYGKQQGQVGWNEKADVNHDGKVDIEDLAIVAKAILQ